MSQGEVCRGLSPNDDKMSRIEAGSTEVAFVPVSVVVDLRQIRETYDEEKLQELADRITVTYKGDYPHFELINPVMIAVFDDVSLLENYLREHALYYDTVLTDNVIDGIPLWNGRWYIRINGHRRGRAILLKCREMGLDPQSIDVSSTLVYNPTFDEARSKQYIENTSDPINPIEDARSIQREYRYRWQEDSAETADTEVRRARTKELSDFFGWRVDKIKAALYFVSMPESIRSYVDNGLSYTNVVRLAVLREAYIKQIGRDGKPRYNAKEAHQRMEDYFWSVVLKRLKGKTKRTIGDAIENKIREVSRTVPYEAEELFVIDEALMIAHERQRVNRELTSTAILTLKHSDPTEEELVTVEAFIAEKRRGRQAVSSLKLEQLFD